MKQLVLASNNAKKLKELGTLLLPLGIDLIPQGQLEIPEAEEPFPTFVENALAKARHAARLSGLPALADDSGLCVDALNQMPGVRSSRWAGPAQEDVANLELVLRQIEDVPDERRTAKFVAVMALVLPDGREFTTRGEMPGRIAHGAKGAKGFGYDPIFRADDQPPSPSGKPRTNAELTAQEKDAISHRGKAVRAMGPVLREVLAAPHQETDS